MRSPVSSRGRLIAATLAATALTAAASPASHAADWSPAADVADGTHAWAIASLGFPDDGSVLASWIDVHSVSPMNTTFGVSGRGPGAAFEDAFSVPTTTTIPADLDFHVAPNGAAVVAWLEVDPAGPALARVRYRTPAGAWEPTVTLSDDPSYVGTLPDLATAIGADGTAVAGVAHLEPDEAGEALTDQRADVFVHPPVGAWDAGTRLSAPNRSALDLDVGVDAEGNATAVWLERFDEDHPGLGWRNTVVVKHRPAAAGAWINDGSVADLSGGAGVDDFEFAVAASGRALIAYGKDSTNEAGDTFVTRRDSASAAFDSPQRVAPVPETQSSNPIAVGVAPNGAYHVLIDHYGPGKFAVLRASGGGPFSAPKPVLDGPGEPHAGLLAFDGNDAFIAGATKGDDAVARVARWRSGATDPDPSSDLEGGQPINQLWQLISDRDGSVAALWIAKDFTARISVHDEGAPRLVESDVPAQGVPGTPLSLSATFNDTWSALQPTEWDLGDGTTKTGATVQHAYAAPGSYAVTARSRDALGNERIKAFAVTIAPAPAATSTPEATPVATATPPSEPQAPGAGRDSVKPKVTLTKPGKRRRKQTLRGTVSDAAPSSGITRVEATATKRGRRTIVRHTTKAPSGAWKLKLPKLAKGTWTFRVRAFDAGGNVSTTARRRARLR